MGWSGGLADWTVGRTAYLSVAFTWRLNDAYTRAVWYRQAGYRVVAGGPGLFTRKHFLADVAELADEMPDAIAAATRGKARSCRRHHYRRRHYRGGSP